MSPTARGWGRSTPIRESESAEPQELGPVREAFTAANLHDVLHVPRLWTTLRLRMNDDRTHADALKEAGTEFTIATVRVVRHADRAEQRAQHRRRQDRRTSLRVRP